MTPDLRVRIGPLQLENPIMPASGCFGPELGQLVDLNRLGALVTKTVFHDARSGNPADRITESNGVMLNSVGIPSGGVESFLRDVLPRYLQWRPPTIVSIGGLRVSDYDRIAERLSEVDGIAALEVNVSCPNLEAGGLEVGADPRLVERVVRGVVDRSRVPVIAKLTPNVTSIGDLARASEAGGATAVSAINTLVGMSIDLDSRRSRLGTPTGGVSGPAIKAVGLRMVWTIARAISIPVIGVGGISNGRDALEYMVVGATAVQFGTANFAHPEAMTTAVEEIGRWLVRHGIADINTIVGSVQLDPLTAMESSGS